MKSSPSSKKKTSPIRATKPTPITKPGAAPWATQEWPIRTLRLALTRPSLKIRSTIVPSRILHDAPRHWDYTFNHDLAVVGGNPSVHVVILTVGHGVRPWPCTLSCNLESDQAADAEELRRKVEEILRSVEPLIAAVEAQEL